MYGQMSLLILKIGFWRNHIFIVRVIYHEPYAYRNNMDIHKNYV